MITKTIFMVKLLRNQPRIKVSKPSPEMQITEVAISLWEEERPKFAPEPPSECAVCGSNKFETGKRLLALLNPRFEGGFRFLMLVWVHPECFESCIETTELKPTPW